MVSLIATAVEMVTLSRFNARNNEGAFMSTTPTASTLFDEIATLFASGPSPEQILQFRPSQASVDRAS